MRKKIIGSYISGRLGNQMFQYAFAKAVKIAQGGDGYLVLNFKCVYLAGKTNDGFEDSLRYFNVERYKTETGNLILKYGSIPQIIVYLAYMAGIKLFHIAHNGDSWLSLFRRVGLLYSHFSDNRYSIFEKYLHSNANKKTYICFGKYENPVLFNHIKPILLAEFTPKAAPLERNKKLYDVIESRNSVCVTIRRGDYLNNQNRNKYYVCDESYFRKAIEKAKCLIEDPVFIFFSDDIEWVKENIIINSPAYYESGKDPVWEKLRLMYSCKHFIISNSTFSWWAQFLSRNENKVVISPNRWFNDTKCNSLANLLSDSFFKIEN